MVVKKASHRDLEQEMGTKHKEKKASKVRAAKIIKNTIYKLLTS